MGKPWGASGVWRPGWLNPNAFSRPPSGWHRVDATSCWHLYSNGEGHYGVIPPAERLVRCCDGAHSDHPRLPRLYHLDRALYVQGDMVCLRCGRVWAALAELPEDPHEIARIAAIGRGGLPEGVGVHPPSA